MTIDYLKTRVQFDQVIGSFQALQHRAAELYTQLQLARCTVRAAAAALEQKKDHVSRSASLSKAMCSDVANHATRELIQLHGGIAMTDEFDAGFYIKRSRVLETAFGSAGWHKERYASICSI
jgi:alkylation response protein AidB-like acyl-CoA dehydrogenase